MPLIPAAVTRSDAVQPQAPQFHKAAKSKSAYENVLDLDEEQLRGISLTALLDGGAALFKDHGAAARSRRRASPADEREPSRSTPRSWNAERAPRTRRTRRGRKRASSVVDPRGGASR